MKKETIIAVSLGIAAGIGIAVFVIKNSKDSSNKSADVILDQLSPTIAIDTKKSDPLLIDEPEDGFVVEGSSITVKGTTQKGSLIILQTPQGEDIKKATSNSFSFNVDLLAGENHMRLTAYNRKNLDTRSLTVYSVPPTK